MENLTFIESIIAQIQDKINQFAINRMTEKYSFDPEKALYEMQSYGYNDLGEYARSKFF